MTGTIYAADGSTIQDFEMELEVAPQIVVLGSRAFALTPQLRPAGGTEVGSNPRYLPATVYSIDLKKMYGEPVYQHPVDEDEDDEDLERQLSTSTVTATTPAGSC